MKRKHSELPYNSEMAPSSRRRKREKSESSSLHALLSSSDPKEHELALSMIDRGARDAEGNSALYLAVKSEAFDVIEAILVKLEIFSYLQHLEYEMSLALAMRSPNAAKLLPLLFSRYYLALTYCCDNLPWDMSNDHLAIVVKTLLRLTGEEKQFDVEKILGSIISKNLELAKLLFGYKTDANERLIDLQSLLSYGSVLQNIAMVAFLIKEGADIDGCVNDRKESPLHVACDYNKLETVRFLLQLGVDVNVTDQFGNTPFSLIFRHSEKERIAKLMIQHFARLIDAGHTINEKDLSAIQSEPRLQRFYESCLEELDRMKTVEAADGFMYHYFFSKSSYELSLLMRNPRFFNQLKRSVIQLQTGIFPNLKIDVFAKFGIAREMKNTLISRECEFEEVFCETFPIVVSRNIARYTLDLKNFEKEYHLNKKCEKASA